MAFDETLRPDALLATSSLGAHVRSSPVLLTGTSPLLALIEPHYPKTGAKGGRPAMPPDVVLLCSIDMRLMIKVTEESLYDGDAMCRFAVIELGDGRIPPFR